MRSNLVPFQFPDGSMAMIDPTNEETLASIWEITGYEEEEQSDYDWSKEDYELKTCGLGERAHDT